MTKGFFRRTWNRYSKLGKGRRKKKVWRRPTGRDNKIRERRKGYPARVSIGYGGERKLRGRIRDRTPLLVNNSRDMEKAGEDHIIIIGKTGKKKRAELMKLAEEKNVPVYNAGKDETEEVKER